MFKLKTSRRYRPATWLRRPHSLLTGRSTGVVSAETEFERLRTRLLIALEPFPEARVAASEALRREP